MNRKQRIIVSVTGIFLVLLILVGLTYAYFLTKIKGNTNDKSISVTTANLEIEYKDNNDIITGDRIEPGTILPIKVFTVTNNGGKSVEYSVGLVNIINTFTNTEDVVYTITCKSYNKEGFSLGTDGTITGTENGTCSGVDETEFPTLNSYIVTNNIDVNIVHAYTMTVTYKETGIDQSTDMNKELSAKIDIFDPKSLTIQGNVTNSSENDYVLIHSKEQESQILNGNYKFIGITPDKHTITVKNRNTTDTKSASLDVEKGTPSVSGSKIIYDEDKNVADMGISISSNTLTLDITKISDGKLTLSETVLASAKKGGENRTVMGSTVTEFTSISGENERVLNNAPDDYGTSYYFRGNVKDNYVTFANKTWRIVRINGDGSVRLVLDDVAKDSSGNAIRTVWSGNSYPYQNYNDNAYIGYMYGTAGSTTYSATHENIHNSAIKKAVDKWYEDNLKTNYANYLADTLFCNDKTLASNGIGGVTTQLGYGKNETYYATVERLRYSTGTTSITTAKPTFKCAESATNDYSRFTVNVTTLSNGNKTNGNLTYPIGLLSVDEVVYAGMGGKILKNSNFYLYNSTIITGYCSFLLTPCEFDSLSIARPYCFENANGNISTENTYNSRGKRFQPSVNLKAELLVGGGDGTKENPYTLLTN